MAIKVFGPDGQVQDFVLATGSAFFVADAAEYVELLERGMVKFFATRPRELANLMRATLGPISNPLIATYYSQTPFSCGDQAVKYCASWRSTSPASAPNASAPPAAPSAAAPSARRVGGASRTEGRDALAAALVSSLSAAPASFDFAVQRQAGEPVDDATARWTAPFTNVARVEIPAQVPTDGEALSFSPGHCLAEHAPLGSINAARVAVYAYIAGRRAQLNAA